ncbi:MAG: hypothetical protein ACO27H_11415 [Burkholderiaceae bacterium]
MNTPARIHPPISMRTLKQGQALPPLARRALLSALLATAAAACGIAADARAQTPAAQRPHKLVMQVSDADPAKWNLALNNARNVQADLGRDKVAIEIVAYGPGLGMLKMDSVVGNRVAEALASGMVLTACENTMTNQKITRADMLSGISYATSGVVQLMQRQREGYAYVRP